ncbi:TraX family protein [Leptotrichia hongkongensis]|uniref:TraX family protein n=1 Tax=Leptotrichia hongkongensis TaxID=554406 RepID=UPI0035A8EDCE
MSIFYGNNRFSKIRIFSGAQLKYIAFLSMLIDHVNKALMYPLLTENGFLRYVSDVFDILGRVAFPLFMFFLVEGFFKTGNRFKYLLNLIVFGIISEIPFDLFQSAVLFQPNSNNVMFTLALALVMIWVIDELKVPKSYIIPPVLWFPVSIIIVITVCLLSMICGLDYEYHGILIAYFFYIFRNNPILSIIGGYLSIFKTPWALLGFGLTLTYNGKRGKQNKILNYLFYPVHLLILGLLRLYFKIGI